MPGSTRRDSARRRGSLHVKPLHHVGVLLLRHDLASIKLHKHRAIRLEVLNRDREAKIVKQEEL